VRPTERGSLPRLSVLPISEAFGQFWTSLAVDLDVTVDILGADCITPPTDAVAFILAAGGAEREGIHWLEAHVLPAGIPCFVVGTDHERRTAVQIMAGGAADYFALPADLEILRTAIATAIQKARRPAPESGSAEANAFAGIVGESPAIRRDLARAARLLPHRHARALIIGETGTGKELLARAIHAGGARHGTPFVAVNCSGLPEHLIESELFGHERGSFTDAHAAKPGLFEVAHTGTLFLDEVAELPIAVQAKLLRVLEDGEVRRVGGTRSRTVDVRILAATNENLARCMREGTFREDLFFRLSTIVLTLPPLRERGDDIFIIGEALLSKLAHQHGMQAPPMTPDIRRRLRDHSWPGNVRELKNGLERALLLSPPGQLNAEELIASPLRDVSAGVIPFPAELQEITTAAARATMQLCGGNRTESARRLGISLRRLRRLLVGRDVDISLEPSLQTSLPV
jgi:DNA-binding NtrC family response regulator